MFDNHVKVIGDGAFFSQLMQMKDGYTDGHNGKDNFNGLIREDNLISSIIVNVTILTFSLRTMVYSTE